ncbi:NAD(P)-dependent oxidoreductase [soil metagenome]
MASSITIGLIHEGRIPADKRVAFTPMQVREIMQRFPDVKVVCQKSEVRCYKDDEFKALEIPVVDDVSSCDILMGIKEVPIPALISNKTYLFFSHTLKKQPYNKKLLQEVLKKKIRLIDYETLRDSQGNRLVAFGRFAGIVGAFNGIWTYGKKYNLFSLRRAYECYDINDVKIEIRNIKLPPIKIILTGAGRVAKGAMEMLDTAGIRKVHPAAFLTQTYLEPVYTQLSSSDYHLRKEGGIFNRDEFHHHPERYESHFSSFTKAADILIAGHFWNPKAPLLFTREDMLAKDFRIKVVADITCDIDGSVPSTKRATSIIDPLYDYDPVTDSVQPALGNNSFITVMAIDNLPCELPRSSSEEFGRDLIDRILKPLLTEDVDHIISRAVIAENGELTSHFEYLKDYVA